MSALRPDDHAFHMREALLPGGWATDVRAVVRGGLFLSVETAVAASPGDERLGAVLPGMPNLHSHAFQRGMAGLAEVRGPSADSFWTWREVMYRFVDRLNPEQLHAIAAQAYVEMLESGFTRVGEFHYLHHDPEGKLYADPAEMTRAIAAAADETGIALTHLPVFYAHAGFGGAAPGPGQRRFLHNLDSFARLLEQARQVLKDLPDGVLGLAPHSLRAVTPEELAALETLAGDGPIHIHVAEQIKEVEDCRAWSGASPVQWLLDHASVDRRWCLVHATHMTDDETRALARSGATAGLCPITEANLGDGVFPAATFLAAGGRYGVGSDSNVMIDLSEELRLLEYAQRLARRGRNLMAMAPGRSTGSDLYAAALAGGAQALGVDAGIAPGLAADFLSLDTEHPSLAHRREDALIDGMIFAAGRAAIDGVWRRGVKRVSGGHHGAREALAARYKATLLDLMA